MGQVIVDKFKGFTDVKTFDTFASNTKSALDDNAGAIKKVEGILSDKINEVRDNVLNLDDKICDEIISSFKEILEGK
jgi:hypothetical protein